MRECLPTAVLVLLLLFLLIGTYLGFQALEFMLPPVIRFLCEMLFPERRGSFVISLHGLRQAI